MLKLTIFSFLLIFKFCTAAHLVSTNNFGTSGLITPYIWFLANVDNKSYFGEVSPLRNWTEAGAYCQSMGMKLATITTEAQWNALESAKDYPGFHRNHWTAGRDAKALRQFSWNFTNAPLSESFIKYLPNDVPFQSCALYFLGLGIQGVACSHRDGTLCET